VPLINLVRKYIGAHLGTKKKNKAEA